ncbi:MAG: class I SAM-dependent methyltransferase [Burkholderiales bacterium]|nr:class I SAM-dependent methyltransferase [Burkholderiales bacterium]
MDAKTLDRANAEFWNELCGTTFARHLGIRDHSPESLRRFDQAYLELYPYLLERVPLSTMAGKRVLEVGLGYGTLGQKIVEAGAIYTGLDIARGPVAMLNNRLRLQGLPGDAMQGSMLGCPLADESVDVVVSIGCFHHTGSVERCIDETWRVLKPGGRAYFMVYNAFSYRQWLKWPVRTLQTALGWARPGTDTAASAAQRKAYDANTAGVAAPETVFVSKTQLRAMLKRFSEFRLWLENCDHVTLRGRVIVPRRLLLAAVGRMIGLDIYVAARK